MLDVLAVDPPAVLLPPPPLEPLRPPPCPRPRVGPLALPRLPGAKHPSSGPLKKTSVPGHFGHAPRTASIPGRSQMPPRTKCLHCSSHQELRGTPRRPRTLRPPDSCRHSQFLLSMRPQQTPNCLHPPPAPLPPGEQTAVCDLSAVVCGAGSLCVCGCHSDRGP